MSDEELKAKIKELAKILRQGQRNGDVIMLPSESQARALALEDRAISIVEEITGEEWEFSYITF